VEVVVAPTGAAFFAWILDGAPGRFAAVLAQLPGPLRLLYRAVWEPPVRQGQPLVSGQPALGAARCTISARGTQRMGR
jgi:hypothetical protein